MLRKLNPHLTYLLQNWATHELRKIGLEYPSRSCVSRFGESSDKSNTKARVPHYEPDGAAKRVDAAIRQICYEDSALLRAKYIEGMSDRIIALICDRKLGKVRWSMEVAHRSIADTLKIPVYQDRTARR